MLDFISKASLGPLRRTLTAGPPPKQSRTLRFGSGTQSEPVDRSRGNANIILAGHVPPRQLCLRPYVRQNMNAQLIDSLIMVAIGAYFTFVRSGLTARISDPQKR